MIIRPRRGQYFIPEKPLFALEQEHSLELPLGYATSATASRVAVILHAFHVDLVPELHAYLALIPVPADLFVSTDTEHKRATLKACFARWAKGTVEIRITPNRGRDIAPKLVGFADVHDRYDFVLHLHTKASPHEARLAGWRGYLLQTLLGSPTSIHGIFEAFARTPKLGMVAPQHIDELRPWIRWGENYAAAEGLAQRMGFSLPHAAPLDFPSGSMFWARSAALRPLLDLRLSFDDFPAESGQTDGTLAHAVERLYFHVCEKAGYDWLKVTAQGELHDQSGVTAVASPLELDRFIARYRLRLDALRDQERSIADLPFIPFPPPKPRRVSHVIWRESLGDGLPLPPGRRLVIALHGAAAHSGTLATSVDVALKLLPAGIVGVRLVLPDASRSLALQQGFAAGADLVLLIGTAGLLHPGSAVSLLRMNEAQGGRAVIEALSVHGKDKQRGYDEDLNARSASGPAIAVPRAIHESVGGLDEHLDDDDAAAAAFTERARELGFAVVVCPRAVFYAADGEIKKPHGTLGNAQIDIITRLDDLGDLPHLDRLFFSVLGQVADIPIQLHVMLQRFAFTEVQAVRSATRDLRKLNDGISLVLHNWDYPAPFELRVPLLNWAMEATQGQYVLILDIRDQLLPNACMFLVEQLRSTNALLAFGKASRQPVWWSGDVILPSLARTLNGCPRPCPWSIGIVFAYRTAYSGLVKAFQRPGRFRGCKRRHRLTRMFAKTRWWRSETNFKNGSRFAPLDTTAFRAISSHAPNARQASSCPSALERFYWLQV